MDSSRHDFVTVVSGLPRSGTSMVMRMLEAGGFDVVVDHVRGADGDNPGGYYEFEPVKQLATDQSWVADALGRAVKVISQLLPDLPANYRYRVIFLQRDMEEILASQKAMLEKRSAAKADVGDHRMGLLFRKHLRRIEAWLAEQPNMQTLYLAYSDVLGRPDLAADSISRFLGRDADTVAMANVVDQSLYRQRG